MIGILIPVFGIAYCSSELAYRLILKAIEWRRTRRAR